MKFVQKTNRLHIYNFDKILVKSNKLHCDLLPNNDRSLIVAPSGGVKTSVMLNLLFNPNGLKFENVYLFSKSIYQEKYKFLETVLSEMPEIIYYEYSEHNEVLDPDKTEPNSVMIFDDVACEQQNKMRSFFQCVDIRKITFSTYVKHMLKYQNI